MALEKGKGVQKKLSPVFQTLVNKLNALPSVDFIAATSIIGIKADLAAEKMQHDYQMRSKFFTELNSERRFSSDAKQWILEQLIGIKLIQSERSTNNSILQSITVGAATTNNLDRKATSKVESDQTLKVLVEGASGPFDSWELPIVGDLQKGIARAGKDPEDCVLIGGLPPTELIMQFNDNVLEPALDLMKGWSRDEKVECLQYPNGGAANRHRNAMIDNFLRPNERQVIIQNNTSENRANGLFFTNGSQEALSMMIEILVSQEKGTKENPVELAITDPTYAGLLMAADKFLKKGEIKFRIIPVDKNGKIDTKALDEALKSKRCKALYLAEGNPLPKQITNLDEVAKVFQNPDYDDKIVFDDHAYDDLGATTENNLFDLLPNKVVSFKTFSKKAAPFRVGFVFSNMTPENFKYVRDPMLKIQYDSKLGFSGLLSGTVAAILQLDAKTAKTSETSEGVFTEHIRKAQAYYEKQRQLYKATYINAFNLIFGENKYNLEDEVTIAEKMFMFGWRDTHQTEADIYSKAGMEMKLFSLSGSNCRPKPEYIVGNQFPNSPTLFHLRQNYTWIEPKKLQLAIFKDVILETVFSKMDEGAKQIAVEKLYRKLIELNDGDLPEVGKFIQKVQANGWQYPKETSE